MYNGIGLRTVRGSGTNGFVQRNRSYVPPPPPQQLTHAQQRDVSMRAQLQITKKANGEMLEHEQKRRIEIKVAEFEEQLRSRNFTEEEIEQKCADARIALTEQMRHTADEINLRDSHQASAAKEKENARLRAAFGIREDRPAGAAFAAMNDKGKKGEEKDAPTEDKPLRLPRSYLDRTIEKREGEEEEDQENPRRKRQRSRSPQREGQGQQRERERERERERGGRDTEDGDRRYDRDRRDVDRGDRGDYGERDRIRRTDDRDRRDRRDERSYDNRDRRDRRDIDEDRYRPRERSPSPFDGQPKMRDDGRDEGEPRSVIVAEPEPEQEQAETKKEAEKGVEGDKQEKKSHEKKREREREKEKEKDKDKGKDKSSSRSKKRSKRSNSDSDSDSSSSSSSSDSDSDSSSSSDSDDDRRKKDSKRKRSPSQD